MTELVRETKFENVGIFLEASSNSISSLLSVLTSGVAFSKDMMDLMGVIKATELLGIHMENWQIGKERVMKNTGYLI